MEIYSNPTIKLQPSQGIKRPVSVDDPDGEDEDKQRKMRRAARAKAMKMTKPPSPTPSLQALDQISEEERLEIIKFVENEQVEGEALDENGIKRIILNFEKR